MRVSRNRSRTIAAFLALVCATGGALPASASEKAKYNAVVELYNAGQWRKAVELIDKRLDEKLTPAMRARYLHARALAYEKGGKAERSRAAYERILEKTPEQSPAHRARLALLSQYAEENEHRAFLKVYRGLDQEKLARKKRRRLRLAQARALAATGAKGKAIKAYRRARSLGAKRETVDPALLELYHAKDRHGALLRHSKGGVAGAPGGLVALLRAEALIARERWKPALSVARRVPGDHRHAARAAYARARALRGLGRDGKAIEPLRKALANLDPAPPGARLALAEGLLAAERPEKARAVLEAARKRFKRREAGSGKRRLRRRGALLRVKALRRAGEDQALARAIAADWKLYPRQQRPRLLHLRLHALWQADRLADLIAVMEKRAQTLRGTQVEGEAILLYARALARSKKKERRRAVLAAYVKRRPRTDAAVEARRRLAEAALDGGREDRAARHLEKLLGSGRARKVLEEPVLRELRFNRAVLALRRDRPKKARRHLRELLERGDLDGAEQARAHRLLGRSHRQLGKPRAATKAWRRALETDGLEPAKARALRKRIARLAASAGRHESAAAAFRALPEESLEKPDRRLYARALAETGRLDAARKQYAELWKRAKSPAAAYEAGVIAQRQTSPAGAAKWYARARAKKSALPAPYAKRVERALAVARLRAGRSDMGRGYWLSRLGPDVARKRFEAAAAALRRIAAAGKLGAAARKALRERLAAYGPESHRRYTVGALLLYGLWQARRSGAKAAQERLAERAAALAAAFAENRASLADSAYGATVAPAMIHFFRGEAERLSGSPATALAAYETVLTAHPYNAWPEAATLGIAKSFADLGNEKKARQRYREVIRADPRGPRGKRWKNRARERLRALGASGR